MKILVLVAGAALFVLTMIQASAEERRRLHPVWGHMPGSAKGNAGNRYCPNSGWVGDKWSCNAKRIIEWEAQHQARAPTR
jgi:hypothetical protein